MEINQIWLDGCVGQLKNDRVFHYLSLSHKKCNVPHIWKYFEIRHGKHEHARSCVGIEISLCSEEINFITNYTI